MNNNSKLRKYYLGFVILLILALVALVYAVSQAGSAKTDRATDKAVESVSSKLDTYIIDKGEIPATLSAAGVNNVPSTVTYTATATSYKICFDYKNASSGFDASWVSLFGGGIGSGQNYGSSDHTYFDSTVQYVHKKGQNCQTVKPSGLGGGYNYDSTYGKSLLQ